MKKKKKLSDFFGILSEEEGAGMQENLIKIRKANLKLKKERIKKLYG